MLNVSDLGAPKQLIENGGEHEKQVRGYHLFGETTDIEVVSAVSVFNAHVLLENK